MSQSFISAASVTIGGTAYDPISFEVTQDNNWTPLWQGTIVIPAAGAPAPGSAAVNPQTWPRLRLRWWFGTHDQATQPLVLDIQPVIRSYVRSWTEDTITIGVASGECMLQDYANAGQDAALGNMTLTAMFNYAMGKVGVGSGNYFTTLPNVTIPAQATLWKAGQSLDDWLRGALRSQSYDIFEQYQDGYPSFGAWWTDNPGKQVRFGFIDAIYGRNIIDLRTGFDMDGTGWGDAAVAEYSWTPAGGSPQRKVYASAPSGAFHRVIYRQFQSADPGYDPAPSMRAIAGRSVATAQLETYPTPSLDVSNVPLPATVGDVLRYQDPTGAWFTTNVSRIGYSYPADRMSWGLSSAQATSAAAPLPLPVP